MKKLLLISILHLFFADYSTGQTIDFNNRPLTKKELSNIMAFTKVYGYVRHFYPSTEVERMKNWEKLIVQNLPIVEQSSGADELQRSILNPFLPYAPLLTINGKGKSNIDSSFRKYIVYRKNKGWGNRGENITRFQFPVFNSELIKIPIDSFFLKEILSPEERLTKKLNDEMIVSWPVSVYANDSFTLPHADDFINDTAKYSYKCSDRHVRLGCIIELWNVMQHFYPYLEDLKINNSQILEKYLMLGSEANNEKRFLEVLELFGAEYSDGHAGFTPYPFSKWANYVPPIRLELIEDKLLVTYSENPDAIGINTGDEVIAINNISSEKFLNNKKAKVSSATKTWNTFTSCKELLFGELNSDLTLKIKSSKNIVKTLVLKRTLKFDALEKKANNRPQLKEYKPGYFYIDLCSLDDSLLDYIEKEILPNAKGIVFDHRGYPRVHVEKLFRHMCTDTLYSAIWQIPIYYYPDQRNVQYDTSGRWKIAPALPKFTNNAVFIIDGRVISAAETEMAMVENYQLGKIIGEQTAGTNGNVNSFKIYDLYLFWFTGMKVLKHDGSRHHGVGIIPQIKVHKTVRDVREGRDPFIETAKKCLQ